MSASFTLDGINDLRTALLAAGPEFADQRLRPLLRQHAHSLAGDVRQQYGRHNRTGNLANHIVVDEQAGNSATLLRSRVRSTARHAYIFEYGTAVRRTNTTKANRGVMPAANVFVPSAIRWRARLYEDARQALQRLRIRGFDGPPDVKVT